MIKQLVEIKEGRLLPSTKALDAKLIAVSKEDGNAVEVKSDGLYSSSKGALLFNNTGVVTHSPKIFTGVVEANGDGDWMVDYSSVGFTQIPSVVVTGQSVGTAAADRRYASISPSGPGLTSCSGKLASASSAGLLAAMTMLAGAGPVHIIAIGI